MLLPAKALVSREATVTCSPTGQSFYPSSFTCATPLTSLCCSSKIKKQKPCLCQYGGSNLDNAVVVESEKGVVAADNGCCSEIGASMLPSPLLCASASSIRWLVGLEAALS
ncbi:hypothetical protein ACJRO7_014024 [Eucalyptus globulus]|uniref:Bifunctional inhibitor/plant lipid transfer protein/seed storage helical domain-containing protein n=1 Tax=Eucalyptus globulus TaxID=34317 RepID=A0ABD3KZQ6_EUCGL